MGALGSCTLSLRSRRAALSAAAVHLWVQFQQNVRVAAQATANSQTSLCPVIRLVRVHNGRRIRKSTEAHSCPNGYKVWSPRNKNDWTIVYNAMKKNINNYPKKPHFIIDVTRPANGC